MSADDEEARAQRDAAGWQDAAVIYVRTKTGAEHLVVYGWQHLRLCIDSQIETVMSFPVASVIGGLVIVRASQIESVRLVCGVERAEFEAWGWIAPEPVEP